MQLPNIERLIAAANDVLGQVQNGELFLSGEPYISRNTVVLNELETATTEASQLTNAWVLEVLPRLRALRGRYWLPEGYGYTDDLNEAARFSKGEAMEKWESNANHSRAVSLLDALSDMANGPEKSQLVLMGDKQGNTFYRLKPVRK